MRFRLILVLLIMPAAVASAEDKPAYRLFHENGKQINYYRALEVMKKVDILFFGELHNIPIVHWLQYEITRDLYRLKRGNLILGGEMFQSDNQLIINEYINGLISAKKFESSAILWKNYKTDYKPLLKFAKGKNLRFIATNIPSRYASIVFRKGITELDKLSNEARRYIAPLPIKYDRKLKCYKKIPEILNRLTKKHPSGNVSEAQAVRDATMAHFILKNFHKDKLFIHFNGNYHSDNFTGIVWHIKQNRRDLKIITISTILQENLDSLEKKYLNIADFILAIPSSMSR